MDISERDYDFMRTHRAPEDHSTNPDEITSRGYFCATVTVQVASSAVRVLHAGQHALRAGTVGICPAGMAPKAWPPPAIAGT